jgi:hypothetical protein
VPSDRTELSRDPSGVLVPFPPRHNPDGTVWSPVLTKELCARAVGLTPRRLEQLIHDGLPSVIGPGGRRLYDLAQVQEFLADRKRKA